MKKIVLLLALILCVSVDSYAKCKTCTVVNNTTVINQADVYDNVDHFKTGAYLQAVLWESNDKNVEVGSFNTYLNETGELTSLVGVKIYLNRLTYQK